MRELKGDWRDLFNGFMVALDLRKCFLALLGVFATILLCGGLTITVGNSLDREAVTPPSDLVLHRWWKTQCQAWDVIYDGAFERKDGKIVFGADGFAVRKATSFGVRAGYTAVLGVLFLAIWSYFGGAICRIAAYEIAKDGERIETRKALQFARKKFWSFFWAPLICLIGFFFFSLCNYAGGFVGKLVDFVSAGILGAPLVALLLPLALLSGFIMTLIGVGTVVGFPLFTPAVAAEGTDSFDAVSRGFSYVYSRPWHFLGYQIVGSVYGALCSAFVILFAISMCHVGIKAGEEGYRVCGLWESTNPERPEFRHIANSSWSLILSSDHQRCEMYRWDPVSIAKAPHPYGRLQVMANRIVDVNYRTAGDIKGAPGVAGYILALWLSVTLGLALSYVVSFFYSQQTLVYFILRKKVDGIEMNEVFEEADEEGKADGDPSKPPAGVTPAADAAPKSEEKKP
jgi:hypothetical protein